MASPSKVKTIQPDPQRQVTIDRFGEVDRLLRLWEPQENPHQAEYDKLEAEILSWAGGAKPETSTVLTGKAYRVKITARGFKSEFSAAAHAIAYDLLQKIDGLDLMQFFSLTITQAKFYLGGEWVKANIPKKQIGERSVEVVSIVKAISGKRGNAA